MIRYAIYFMPAPQSPLWRFGCSVLGYDADSGSMTDHPPANFFETEFDHHYVSEPQKYGFHATLKAPFALAAGMNEQHLCEAAMAFAAKRTVLVADPLKIAALGPFLALIPAGDPYPFTALADDCVRDFDMFRAPASAADRARRLTASLTPRQADLMDRWGYPYVFDEFRFHMTLSSSLNELCQTRFRRVLETLFAPIQAPLAIDCIAIFKQTAPSDRFHVLDRIEFGGGPARTRTNPNHSRMDRVRQNAPHKPYA
jgi:putative phosphonate metabolism protein